MKIPARDSLRLRANASCAGYVFLGGGRHGRGLLVSRAAAKWCRSMVSRLLVQCWYIIDVALDSHDHVFSLYLESSSIVRGPFHKFSNLRFQIHAQNRGGLGYVCACEPHPALTQTPCASHCAAALAQTCCVVHCVAPTWCGAVRPHDTTFHLSHVALPHATGRL